ncbi:MAG: MBL fold metallo-hydrolase [Ruminococcaceae bacterium]|nr:MBL fold metallo-hydrolase [Oscillospiraceae bacterium]
MLKLHILGTCAGTEPMPERHHCSFAVEFNNRLYFFDAGECCSYTAHLKGIDLMRTRKIIISHTHMDHIGGLGNLFWNIRKLDGMHHTLQNRDIELFIPEIRAWEGIYQMLTYTEGGFKHDFNINAHEYSDGILFDDDGIRVRALHNHHLPHEDGAPWKSFGFLIEAEGKRIVYSGDTKGIADYSMLLPANLLITETGHHNPINIATELISRDQVPDTLAFIHHGRDILNHYNEMKAQLKQLMGNRAIILEDYSTITL